METTAMNRLKLALSAGVLLLGSSTPALQPNLDQLLDAIRLKESSGGRALVGDNGRALGPYQIHKSYWSDSMVFLGKDWPYEKALDEKCSRMAVRAYLEHYGKGKSWRARARIHNGGPLGDQKVSTETYARAIEQILRETTR